jgi:hypothetical protein
MSRNVLVAILGLMVFVVVAGAIYLQILLSARETDAVWAITRSVSAGDVLDSSNVHQTRIPRSGDSWDFYAGDLLGTHVRAAHQMRVGTILFSSDVSKNEVALVTLSLRTPPPLKHGETVDVYAQVSGQTILVGRRLAVEEVSGNNCSVWVPVADEPSWITLQAGNVSLLAAMSTGIGVPQARSQTVQDALGTLNGAGAPVPIVIPVTSPTPTPKKT